MDDRILTGKEPAGDARLEKAVTTPDVRGAATILRAAWTAELEAIEDSTDYVRRARLRRGIRMIDDDWAWLDRAGMVSLADVPMRQPTVRAKAVIARLDADDAVIAEEVFGPWRHAEGADS